MKVLVQWPAQKSLPAKGSPAARKGLSAQPRELIQLTKPSNLGNVCYTSAWYRYLRSLAVDRTFKEPCIPGILSTPPLPAWPPGHKLQKQPKGALLVPNWFPGLGLLRG